MDKNQINFKVKSDSNVYKLSLSLFKLIEEGNDVYVTAIGAGAVNQAVKVISKSRAFIAQSGKDLTVRIGMKRDKVGDREDMSIALFYIKVE